MEHQKKKVLFYYLSAFSNTGGIEKFNRCFIKALNDIADDGGIDLSIVSVYDSEPDERYINRKYFRGFNKRRSESVRHIIRQSYKHHILVLGHINLSIAGWLVKKIRPGCKVYVIAHGIEVWDRMFFVNKWMLKCADMVLSVSNYTKNQLVLRNHIEPSRINLFPNTIDPFFEIPTHFRKPDYLLQRYGLRKDQPIILTLSRLVSSEKYKGYDKVISALPAILEAFPDAVYILAGRYDEGEKQRIDELVHQHQLADHVILTGYVKDEEVPDHYCLADVFIMPSRKEGFGIVFLEALACGTQVIGGNQDGTVDALLNGALGLLINPTKIEEISAAVGEVLTGKKVDAQKLQSGVLDQYRFTKYKIRLALLLNN